MKLNVGQSSCITKTIFEDDVYEFARLSGDTNGIHLDEKVAAKSIFGSRVVHGMLIGSLISTVLGTKLPGDGTIYLEQKLEFKSPVYFGDTITVIVEVSEIINDIKGIYKLNTEIRNQNDEIVVSGYAIVKCCDG